MTPARRSSMGEMLDQGLFDVYETEYGQLRCCRNLSRSTLRLFTDDVKRRARSPEWREALEEFVARGIRNRKTSANRLVLLTMADEALVQLRREQRRYRADPIASS
jgi:hypothetical protein